MTKSRPTAVLVAVLLLAGPALSLSKGPLVAAQRGPGGPTRIVLIVDSSSAVSSMLTHFRAGLNSFLDALPGEPEMAIISTGGQLRIRVAPTTDRTKLRAAANGFSSDGGGNSFLDTLLEADRRFLKSAADRRSIVVILTTDAGSAMGEVRVDAYNRFADEFQARGGRAHAIVVRGANSGMTTQIAENLARNTGGYYDVVGIANALPKLMKILAEYVAADL
jgi:hypothetical protein